MKIKIHLRSGNTVDFEVPDTTHFGAMCLHIKASGYFLSDVMFIPLDWIGVIVLDGTPTVQKVVMPGPETKQ